MTIFILDVILTTIYSCKLNKRFSSKSCKGSKVCQAASEESQRLHQQKHCKTYNQDENNNQNNPKKSILISKIPKHDS